jgi:hypothetical protein
MAADRGLGAAERRVLAMGRNSSVVVDNRRSDCDLHYPPMGLAYA